ncbi:MAG: hypothetical protein LBL61_06420 [Elusimicrobiota bacterium]|jgi:hypothetical protein|nr:hypothetical protein [Elusimicrobiota bacterium]
MSFLNKFDKLLGIKRLDCRECLGIYISPNDVYVSQIVEKSGGIEVETLIKLPVGEVNGALLKPAELNEGFFAMPSYWLDPLKKIINSKKWNTKNVVVSLAPNFSIYRHFVMQDLARKYWKKTIPLQARKYIHYPFERGVYDYYVYPFYAPLSKAKRLGVVFSLAPARIASTIEAGIKSLGLNLVALESSPLSVYRLFNHTDKEARREGGSLYANFTNHSGQFLFALNNIPVLLREVEVNRALGSRNRLEVNNCMDFVSKQLEKKNPFEDTAVISDDGDFWAPIIEGEVKHPVRRWRISDIFGFKVEGFAEMAPVGAALKFVNQKVADIDLFRKNRSTEEEVRGITAVWQVAGFAVLLMMLWCGWQQISAVLATKSLASQSVVLSDHEPDFTGLNAGQIEEKVRTMSSNAKTLDAMIDKVSYTEKLSALPSLLPAEMWLTRLDLRYPYTVKAFKERNVMKLEGYASTHEGRQKELQYGSAFAAAVDKSPAFADVCKGTAKIDYGYEDAARSKVTLMSTKITLECAQDVK